MRPRFASTLVFAAVLAAPVAAKPQVHDVCPSVRFIGKNPKLSANERKLVCGDPGTDGWKKIPLSQAKYFITGFLQHRGRYFPNFEVENEKLIIDIGTTTYVRKLTGTGLGGIYDLGKIRKVVGKTLTPELLDKTKADVQLELQSRGYPCPTINVTADARTGEAHVQVDPGEHYAFKAIPPPKLTGLDPGVMGRYEAFQDGEPFDVRMLTLTSERMKLDALFLSAYYDVRCSTSGVHIVQQVVEAKPHLVTLGIGADTEGLVTGRARWQENRIGYRASTAQVNLLANEREQSLDANMRYFLSPSARLHMMPEAFIRREDEVQYEAAHSELQVRPGWTHDGTDFYLETHGGPAIDYFNTLRGLGPHYDRWMAFNTTTMIRTHLYEYFEADPRRGWTATLNTSSRLAGADSAISSHRIQFNGESLWNLGKYDPPLAILATRGLVGTTWVPNPAPAVADIELPPSDRFFLGGDADLRGVSRKALPGDGTGFLTAIYEGVELRAGDVLPARLEPFTFIDAAMGGMRPFHVDGDVYYSPGVGLRWASPFGSVRTTVARGLTWRNGGPTTPPRPHWQFFFSFGKEF